MSAGNPSWSGLSSDLLIMIAKRLELMEDFVAFRGVCVSWREAVNKNCCNRSLPKVPILMLAEEEGDSDDREFFSLSKGKIWFKMPLPEAKGKRCIESRGWFITVGWEGEMHLLHPFSRVQIELPNISTTKDYDAEIFYSQPHEFIYRAALSCSPFESSYYAVMVSGAAFALYCWRPGNKAWTRIDMGHTGLFSDISFFNERFYVVNYIGEIWVCDVSGFDIPRVSMITRIDDAELYSCKQAYLVESLGELLVVFRDGHWIEKDDNGEWYYGASHFDVVQLDLDKGKGGWTVMKSLGDRSVFVGHNASFSIDAKSFAGSMIKPNCIYFTDDSQEAYYHATHGGGKDMGVYHLEDREIKRLPDFHSLSKISPPVWVSPYF